MTSRRHNIAALAVCQGLLITNNISIVSIGSLAGYALASNKALATLPATAYVIGAALSSYPISLFMRRHGRRAGFTLGALAGVAGALLCTGALALGAFWLFCLGTLVAGVYNAAGGYYRFAAADAAEQPFKSRAISLVLAGGMIGGVLGPESSKLTKDALSVAFLGTYAVLALFALAAVAVARRVDLPPPSDLERSGAARSMREIARQPVYLVACLGAMAAFASMNLLMGVTPLAMQLCGLPYSSTALVIEWHIIGMFAPALFVGSLVHRFGAPQVMAAGVATYLCCVGIALSGQSVLHFWVSGTLLGVGWCLLYVGATTLLTQAYTPGEKAKAQGVNDTLVFMMMASSNALSGAILYRHGWSVLNYTALPLLLLTLASLAWLGVHRRAQARPPAPLPTILE